MRRRDFLQPQHLAQAAGQVCAAVSEPQPIETAEAPALVRYSRRAMATTFEVVLPYGTPSAFLAASAALEEIDRIEGLLTVYRDDSVISRINQRAFREEVEVDAEVFQLLMRAVQLTKDTDGAFDIATGALIKTWGFYKGPRRVPTPVELSAALQRTGMQHVQLNAERRTVRFTRPGVELNLGSIGKGYALDCAAELLRRDYAITSALLHGGHSSVYAIGTGPGDERGWPVGITHPWDPERRLAIVHLKDRGLGTSAATFKHLEWHGRKLGHILDPRRGWPAEGMASASVMAPTAAEADALATGLFILGLDNSMQLVERRSELGGVFVRTPEEALVVLGQAP
jgi:thiamine biosynthesis lipoprotein